MPALPRPVAALLSALALAAVSRRSAKWLCVRIVRISRIDETGAAHAQHFFHLLDRFVDHATRMARLKLVLQFNESSIGTVEATRQDLRNVKERDRILRKQVRRVGDMKLRSFQCTHVRCVWLI